MYRGVLTEKEVQACHMAANELDCEKKFEKLVIKLKFEGVNLNELYKMQQRN